MDLGSAEPAAIPFGAIPQKTGWLRPPWRPGQSGNPSGKAKDGGGSKDAPLRKLLHAKARKRRELQRLVDAWWDAACTGSDQAREQILRRLDPVLDDPAQGRQILTGLKLELQVGKGPVTTVRGAIAQHVTPMPDGEQVTGELPAKDLPGLLEGYRQTRQTQPTQASEAPSEPLEGTQVSEGPGIAADQSI